MATETISLPIENNVESANRTCLIPITDQFEKIVHTCSDRLAVKMGHQELTYDQLNRKANRIANAIIEKCGKGSEPVALMFEPGIDIIAGILGVLKAGKFYIALEPSSPAQRVNFILKDSGARLLVTQHRSMTHSITGGNSHCEVLNIEEIKQTVSFENPGLPVSLHDPANLRYTSGSTGEPKGVVRTHGSSSQITKLMPVALDDRFSLLHSLSFGSAAADLYLSLLNGASLFPFNVKTEGVQRLAGWLREEQITICHLPPALFRQLAELLSDEEELADLRLVCLSGSPITRLDFDLYKKSFSSRTLLQISMGATEAGRIGTAILDRDFAYPQQGTPAGYAPPGTTIMVRDDDGHDLAPLQIGEIAIKGSGLASGYWHQNERSGAKFIADPAGQEQQIYLTGDLGLMRPDGFLIHMGRKDLMVKIRGYRVELGEIERALLLHSNVKEAGVVAWDRDGEDKFLAAYIVGRQSPPPTIYELNSFLKATLPDYMMPSTYSFLDSLPLINGKLNRTALPRPDAKRPLLEQPYTAPRSDIESKIAEIWRTILEVDPIGVHDNFFDLGGHSLNACRIIFQVIRTFHFEVPLQALFEAPTVAQMAALIETQRAGQANEDTLAQVLGELEAMSEEEARRHLARHNMS